MSQFYGLIGDKCPIGSSVLDIRSVKGRWPFTRSQRNCYMNCPTTSITNDNLFERTCSTTSGDFSAPLYQKRNNAEPIHTWEEENKDSLQHWYQRFGIDEYKKANVKKDPLEIKIQPLERHPSNAGTRRKRYIKKSNKKQNSRNVRCSCKK